MNTRTLLYLAAAGALVAAPFVAPPTAHADPLSFTDLAYVAALRDRGVPIASPTEAILYGHAICTDLDNGFSHLDEVDVLIANLGYSFDDAAYMVGDATAAYCPAHNLADRDTEAA